MPICRTRRRSCWGFIQKCREGVRRGLCHSGQAKSLHSSGRRTTSIIARCAIWPMSIFRWMREIFVISRRALDTLNALPERNRFVRGMRTWIGYRQIGMAYERQARAAGEPKYTLRSLMNLALDGVVNFSYKPLRMFGILGMATGSLAPRLGRVSVSVSDRRDDFGYNPRASPGWTSLTLMILIFAAIQLFGIGILGEYIEVVRGDQATAAVSGGRHDKLSRLGRLLFPASAAAGTPPEPLTGLLCQLEDPDRCEVSKQGYPAQQRHVGPLGRFAKEIPHRREEVERAGRHQHERLRPPAREPRPEFLQLRVGGGRSNGETSGAWYGISS